MELNTDYDSRRSSSVVILEGASINKEWKDFSESGTQYSLESVSSYEVIDAFTQVSSSLLQLTDNSTTTSEDCDGDDVDRFSKEWKAVVFRDRNETNSDSFVLNKKKGMSGQSAQDMIELLKKSVKEGNIKAQESVKDFFQPTPEELQRIRKRSLHFSKFKTRSKTSNLSEDSLSPDVSECQLFLQSAQIDKTKKTALSSSPNFPKDLEKFVTPTASRSAWEKPMGALKKQESCVMYKSMVPETQSNTVIAPTEDRILQQSIQAPIKMHPNGRYADEAEDFYQESPPPPSKLWQRRCYTDTKTSESISKSLSKGEAQCRCNTSIGELHLCKYSRNIKGRVQYLKRNPEKLLQYEMAEPDLKVVGQRRHNLNWVRYYVKRP